jgi:hypothetical protein
MADEDISPEETRPVKRVKLEGQKTTALVHDDDQLQKELRAGITRFVSPNTLGFSGVLKQRYELQLLRIGDKAF